MYPQIIHQTKSAEVMPNDDNEDSLYSSMSSSTCNACIPTNRASIHQYPDHQPVITNWYSAPTQTRRRGIAKISEYDNAQISISSVQQFEDAAKFIESNNNNNNNNINNLKILKLFNTLKQMTRRLEKNDNKYRTIYPGNPKFQQHILGFNGAIKWLNLLGFKYDTINDLFICYTKPSIYTIKNAVDILIIHIKILRNNLMDPDDDDDDNDDDHKYNEQVEDEEKREIEIEITSPIGFDDDQNKIIIRKCKKSKSFDKGLKNIILNNSININNDKKDDNDITFSPNNLLFERTRSLLIDHKITKNI